MRFGTLSGERSYGSDSDGSNSNDDYCFNNNNNDECEEEVWEERREKKKVSMKFAGKNARVKERDILQEYGELKKKARMAFEEIQTTGEYMESHYFKQRSYAEARDKVAFSAFWLDYAEHLL